MAAAEAALYDDCLADACLDGEAERVRELLVRRKDFLATKQRLRGEVEAEIFKLVGATAPWDVDRAIGEYCDIRRTPSPILPELPQGQIPRGLEGMGFDFGASSSSLPRARDPERSRTAAAGAHRAHSHSTPHSPNGPTASPLGGVPRLRRFAPARTYTGRAEAPGGEVGAEHEAWAHGVGRHVLCKDEFKQHGGRC